MRTRTHLLAVSTCLALAGLALTQASSPAHAQTCGPPTCSKQRVAVGNGDGMDLNLFKPAVDSKGFFSVNGTDILGHTDLSIGLILDYGYGTTPVNGPPAGTSPYLREHGIQGTPSINLGLFNWITIGLSTSIILGKGYNVGELGPTGAVYQSPEYDEQSLGSIQGHIKLRLVPPDKALGVAIIGQVGGEVAGSRNFSGEPGFWYHPQLVLERRFFEGKFRLGLQGGYRGHTGANPTFGVRTDGQAQLAKGELNYSDLVTAGFGLSVRPLDVLDLVAETYGTYQVGGTSADDQRASAEAVGGIKLFIERNSYFYLSGGGGYLPGFQTSTARAMIGFVFEPSIGDKDGDGIKDDVDDCPNDPEDFDGFQDTKADSPPGKYGCPDPDNDNDGILDVNDRCKNDPEDRDGDQDEDGCPEGSDGDRDGDGILDSRDKCPDVPEDRDGFEDKDGCPDLDNDKDGIPDTQDGPNGSCRDNPEDKDNFEDTDGCPDPDNDKDGILDDQDGPGGSCKNDPETFNGLDDEDGCPDKGNVIIQENNILILEKVLFKTGSAEILAPSFGIIDAVAATLVAHPEFKLIEIQGHADERGDDKLNLKLTQDRANAVLEALSKRKVDKARMRSMGYGEYCPLDPASNKDAWEKNRRVEFKIVKSDKGDTGVELGCEAARKKGVQPPP